MKSLFNLCFDTLSTFTPQTQLKQIFNQLQLDNEYPNLQQNMIEKLQTYKNILRYVNCLGIGYGGFARDTLFGVMPKDLDIFFSYDQNYYIFLDWYQRYGKHGNNWSYNIIETRLGNYDVGNMHQRITIHDNTNILIVDCSYPEITDRMFKKIQGKLGIGIDFDVNALIVFVDNKDNLIYNVNPILQSIIPNRLTEEKIIKNIQSKQFEYIGLRQYHTPITELQYIQYEGHICYHMNSKYGRKLKMRVKSLTDRGWKFITKCKNQDCWINEK